LRPGITAQAWLVWVAQAGNPRCGGAVLGLEPIPTDEAIARGYDWLQPIHMDLERFVRVCGFQSGHALLFHPCVRVPVLGPRYRTETQACFPGLGRPEYPGLGCDVWLQRTLSPVCCFQSVAASMWWHFF